MYLNIRENKANILENQWLDLENETVNEELPLINWMFFLKKKTHGNYCWNCNQNQSALLLQLQFEQFQKTVKLNIPNSEVNFVHCLYLRVKE